jgi:hypothetical protein
VKDFQATEEAFSPQKRTSSTSKHEISNFFLTFVTLWVIFALLDPELKNSTPKILCGSKYNSTGGSLISKKVTCTEPLMFNTPRIPSYKRYAGIFFCKQFRIPVGKLIYGTCIGNVFLTGDSGGKKFGLFVKIIL